MDTLLLFTKAGMRIQEITYMGARKVVKEMMFPASQKILRKDQHFAKDIK
jgi:hypothetical protein